MMLKQSYLLEYKCGVTLHEISYTSNNAPGTEFQTVPLSYTTSSLTCVDPVF